MSSVERERDREKKFLSWRETNYEKENSKK